MRVQFRRHQRWDWEDHVAQIDGGGLGRRIAILEAGVQGRGGVYRRTHKKAPDSAPFLLTELLTEPDLKDDLVPPNPLYSITLFCFLCFQLACVRHEEELKDKFTF